MIKINSLINKLKIELLIVILYSSLLFSFYLGENSTGGAILDYQNQSKVINQFLTNFTNALINYDNLEFTTRHSPVLIIILSFLVKINLSDDFIRLIYLHVNLILPIFFYKCLTLKFKSVDKTFLILLSGLIILSPSFRSLSIWPDSRILGLTIFSISIYYFLLFFENKKYKYAIFNIIYYAIASYISPNFLVFSLFFFYFYLKQFNLFSKKLILIILINIFLSIPAFFYVFYMEVQFIFAKATVQLAGKDKLFLNFFNQILIIPTIIFFYLFPFIYKKIFIFNKKDINLFYVILGTLVFCISLYFFNYNLEYTGGGLFLHLSQFLFKNNILFFFISFFSIILIFVIHKNKIENLILIILIFLNNPQTTIYHKYFDPLLLILFFTLFNYKISNIDKVKSYYFIYLYFIIFLLVNNFKYLIS